MTPSLRTWQISGTFHWFKEHFNIYIAKTRSRGFIKTRFVDLVHWRGKGGKKRQKRKRKMKENCKLEIYIEQLKLEKGSKKGEKKI